MLKRLTLKIMAGILILGAFNHIAAASTTYEQCNICIDGPEGDPTPKGTFKECKTWLHSVRTENSFQQIIRYSQLKTALQDSAITCNNIQVHGSFHADETYARLPFNISLELAKAYQAKSLSYSGSSCRIFKNIKKLEKYAKPLLAWNSTIFSISGNQNKGLVKSVPLLMNWHEQSRDESKVTILIKDGTSALEFQKCSIVGKACRLDFERQTSKYCSDENEQVRTQTCCPSSQGVVKSHFGLYQGMWMAAGESCAQ